MTINVAFYIAICPLELCRMAGGNYPALYHKC